LLAAAIGAQKSFISGVLNGKAHFSLEQAYKVSTFLSHTDDEREFFLLLVQLGRAGSKELESFFKRKVQSVLAGRREVSERITPSARLTDVETADLLFKLAIHGRAHVPEVPGLREADAIAKYLNLPRARVMQALQFLVRTGLVVQQGSVFETGRREFIFPPIPRL